MIQHLSIEKCQDKQTEDQAIIEEVHHESPIDKVYTINSGAYRDQYISLITSKSPLNAQEEKTLFKKFLNGDEKAKDAIIESNLPIIHAVAEKYVALYPNIDIQDLIGEGVIALCNALKTYNPSFNVRFAKYTMRGIKLRMQECILSYHFLIHIPYDVATTIERIIKIEHKYFVQHGIPITLDELSLELGESIERIVYCSPFINYSTTDFSENIDFLESEYYADGQVWQESLSYEIDRALRCLHPREGQIIREIFGIGAPEKTFEDVGTKMDLTSDRVRQIKNNSIRKLKASKHSKILKTYVNFKNNLCDIDTDIDMTPYVITNTHSMETPKLKAAHKKVKTKEEKKAERIKRNKKIIEKQIAEIIKPHLNELPLPCKGIYRNNYLNRLISETRKIIKLLNEWGVSQSKLPSPKIIKIKNKGDLMSHLDKNLSILEQESYVSARTLNELRTNIAVLHEKCKSK